jgi:succinate-semialdehyde dehydrogenase/glutarate-semialdehyde dehydrogenase
VSDAVTSRRVDEGVRTVSNVSATAPVAYEGMLIGGEIVESHSTRRFDVIDPARGVVVGSVPDATRDDVVRAIDSAQDAFEGWRGTPARERGRALQRAAELMRNRVDGIARTLTAEQGKPLTEARGEVEYAASFLEWFAGEAERVYGQMIAAQDPQHRVMVLREPVGVAAAVTPWNFPAAMVTRKLGPAIAAGCTSVIKPAEQTPLTAALILAAIQDAGIPAGVANMVTSTDPAMVAETLFGDPRVRKLSFTGSTEVGKRLIGMSASTVTRLSLELGGHAPFIVFDDADVDAAVDGLIASKFRNAGQTCVCPNRVFVQSDILPRFVDTAVDRIAGLRTGPGTADGVDIGPLIDEAALLKVPEHVADAIAKGASLLTGGTPLHLEESTAGHYYAPTVLEGLTPQMLIWHEETFGPVIAIASFDSEAEVVALANTSPYGLAAYLYIRDYARLLRVAERLECGLIGANSGAISAANVPFGGMKQSGYGREGGSAGIDEYLEVKYVLLGGVGR